MMLVIVNNSCGDPLRICKKYKSKVHAYRTSKQAITEVQIWNLKQRILIFLVTVVIKKINTQLIYMRNSVASTISNIINPLQKIIQQKSIQNIIFKTLMEIKHEHFTTKGDFFVQDEQDRKIAVMTYVMVNDVTMLIEHTIVDESLGGQGIGRKLVDAGVQFARVKGYKIIPQCPYANSVFKKTPEYADVLAS